MDEYSAHKAVFMVLEVTTLFSSATNVDVTSDGIYVRVVMLPIAADVAPDVSP